MIQKHFPLLLAVSFSILSPLAQASVMQAPLPKLLQEVEAKYAAAATMSAEFAQTNESAALKQTKKSSGRIYAKRPGKVRWETLKPEANLLVSDGVRFWYYTPPFDETEHGQLIEKKSSQVQSKLANALLSGSFSIARDMKIRAEGGSSFTLVPKPGTAGTVASARIQVNPTEKLIEKVILQHKDGNRSEIELKKIELGRQLGEELFHFSPPPNTDRVDADK